MSVSASNTFAPTLKRRGIKQAQEAHLARGHSRLTESPGVGWGGGGDLHLLFL